MGVTKLTASTAASSSKPGSSDSQAAVTLGKERECSGIMAQAAL